MKFIIQPNAPVVTRAALLLECAHYVQKANNSQWASWTKQNFILNRQSGANMNARVSVQASSRRTAMLQRAAGKMFYQWGEVIGMRLEEMLNREKQDYGKMDAALMDPERQSELVQEDEEEDFLDEASVNPTGRHCPPALKLIACLLLYEITSFLRETYQQLPKATKMSMKEKAPWEKVYREANRRWSMALSSMGHSQTSAQSLQSIAGVDTERKISFVLHEPDNESEHSSNTTVTMQGEEQNNAPVNTCKFFHIPTHIVHSAHNFIHLKNSHSDSTKAPDGKCPTIFTTPWNSSSSTSWRLI